MFGHAYIVNVSVRILHNFEVNDIVYAVKHEMRLLDETSSRCALEDHPCCLHYTHMETRLCLCPSVLNQQSICLSSLRRYPSVKVEDSRVVDPIISPPGKERCRPQWVVDKDCSLDFWDVVGKRTIDTKSEGTDMATIEYTCISHTWGSFGIKGPGVPIQSCPWLVPCNMQFDVE